MKKLILLALIVISLSTIVNAQVYLGEKTTKVYLLSNGELCYITSKNDTLFVTYDYNGLTQTKSKENALSDKKMINNDLYTNRMELREVKSRIEAIKADSIKIEEVLIMFE